VDSVTWQEQAGRKILVADYRNKTQEEMIAVIEEVARRIQAVPPGVRLLADFRGCSVGTAYMKRAKEINTAVFGPRDVRLALLGVDGLKAILVKGFNAVSRGIPAIPCASEQDAYAYLAS
jgi:hypothetical protein